MRALVLGLCVFLFSCTEPEKKTTSRIDSLVSLPIPLDCVNQKTVKIDSVVKDTIPPAFKFEGTITCNRKYCGGARPTEDILAEYAKENPFVSTTFKLRNGSNEYFFKTDDKGNFSVIVPHGNYALFTTTKVNNQLCVIEPVYFSNNKKQKFNFTLPCDSDSKKRP